MSTTTQNATGKTARPAERDKFILNYLADLGRYGAVDVLDTTFVRAYLEATGAPATERFIGAPTCPTLGRDLSRLHREGRLERSRVGVGGEFASWVYVYNLPACAGGGESR